jgi:hypothetical protein
VRGGQTDSAELAESSRDKASPSSARSPVRPPSVLGRAAASLIVLGAVGVSIFMLVNAHGDPSSSTGSAATGPATASIEAPRHAFVRLPETQREQAVGVQPSSGGAAEPGAAEGIQEPRSSSPVAETDLPLPDGATVPAGRGLLEVHIDSPLSILVDGITIGSGPFQRVPLLPGTHRVIIVTAPGRSTVLPVDVLVQRLTRLRVEAGDTVR